MASIPTTPNPQPPTGAGSVYCTDPNCKSCKDLREVQQDLAAAK
jgi:hypothetical protein